MSANPPASIFQSVVDFGGSALDAARSWIDIAEPSGDEKQFLKGIKRIERCYQTILSLNLPGDPKTALQYNDFCNQVNQIKSKFLQSKVADPVVSNALIAAYRQAIGQLYRNTYQSFQRYLRSIGDTYHLTLLPDNHSEQAAYCPRDIQGLLEDFQYALRLKNTESKATLLFLKNKLCLNIPETPSDDFIQLIQNITSPIKELDARMEQLHPDLPHQIVSMQAQVQQYAESLLTQTLHAAHQPSTSPDDIESVLAEFEQNKTRIAPYLVPRQGEKAARYYFSLYQAALPFILQSQDGIRETEKIIQTGLTAHSDVQLVQNRIHQVKQTNAVLASNYQQFVDLEDHHRLLGQEIVALQNEYNQGSDYINNLIKKINSSYNALYMQEDPLLNKWRATIRASVSRILRLFESKPPYNIHLSTEGEKNFFSEFMQTEFRPLALVFTGLAEKIIARQKKLDLTDLDASNEFIRLQQAQIQLQDRIRRFLADIAKIRLANHPDPLVKETFTQLLLYLSGLLSQRIVWPDGQGNYKPLVDELNAHFGYVDLMDPLIAIISTHPAPIYLNQETLDQRLSTLQPFPTQQAYEAIYEQPLLFNIKPDSYKQFIHHLQRQYAYLECYDLQPFLDLQALETEKNQCLAALDKINGQLASLQTLTQALGLAPTPDPMLPAESSQLSVEALRTRVEQGKQRLQDETVQAQTALVDCFNAKLAACRATWNNFSNGQPLTQIGPIQQQIENHFNTIDQHIRTFSAITDPETLNEIRLKLSDYLDERLTNPRFMACTQLLAFLSHEFSTKFNKHRAPDSTNTPERYLNQLTPPQHPQEETAVLDQIDPRLQKLLAMYRCFSEINQRYVNANSNSPINHADYQEVLRNSANRYFRDPDIDKISEGVLPFLRQLLRSIIELFTTPDKFDQTSRFFQYGSKTEQRVIREGSAFIQQLG